ncbi:hypothetical protein A9P82_11985 [Arachidicoccus ginsenosidimutans]|uniref:hypothetical protein n=1 Tax=Arachidicoccus sp. BS20 TaxID=1850526 RepID=UPI0007F0BEAB|nr:hypothetical protein [Arachidicoccus sp. BS20]ANI89945.1 hypothetical protein A9P82_11985 [Arachidicoccus sp. BS20]
MAYTNYPSATPQESDAPQNKPPKDNRKLIYGILIALLLLTWGYIIYDHSKSNQEIAGLQLQKTNSDSAKEAIQVEYNDALRRMDSLTGSNTQLQGTLAQQKSEIDNLKAKIEQIRKEDNGDLTRAKNLIDQLNGKVNDLYTQIAALQKQNDTLTANNHVLASQRDTLIVQNKTVSDSLQAAAAENQRIIDEASTLHASNFGVEAINAKGDETTKAKKADLLRVFFTIDENKIAPSGPKDLYVIITGPDGRVISIPSQGSGTFQTREDGQKVYTNLQSINYTQGQKQKVSFDWSMGSRFQAGDYKIEVYNNGYKIGEGVKTLKKSGFLGL